MTSNMVLVTGNTYPVKEQIKALGGRWDGANKGWKVPSEQLAAAQALVAGAPKAAFTRAKSGFTHYRCRDCGCAPSQYNKIYRNGQCKDCWLGDKEERDMGY